MQKYLTNTNKQYQDWMECKDSNANVYWTHKNTLEETFERPGVQTFHLNKKSLKNKAEEDLLASYKGVYAPQNAIMETLLGLKHKMVTDLAKMRLRHTLIKRQKETPEAAAALLRA